MSYNEVHLRIELNIMGFIMKNMAICKIVFERSNNKYKYVFTQHNDNINK